MSAPKLAFQMRRVRIPLDNILPVRQIKDANNCSRYRTIVCSIRQVGLLEPLSVYPQKGCPGKYLLMDGHLRLCAIRSLGEREVECILATEDESFTYNARVNRLNPIMEHRMIVKAVQNGVPPKRIAEALNLQLSEVRSSMTLLDGVHEEAVEMLKDKAIGPKTIKLLKRVSGVRQIEMAELMVGANNYTRAYAEALVLGTPKSELVNPEELKSVKGMTREEIGRLQVELETLGQDFKALDQAYGENMLTLSLARGYIRKLLENGKVVRFLQANYREILGEFETTAMMEGV